MQNCMGDKNKCYLSPEKLGAELWFAMTKTH